MTTGPRPLHGPDHSDRVYPFREVERRILDQLGSEARILDLGCSHGDNLVRLASAGRAVGVDVSLPRLRGALPIAPVAAATGERLPFGDGTFDFIYVSHVLHHAPDHRAVLREAHRVLRPEGVLFLVETFDDSPMIRLLRAVGLGWDRDRVPSRFRFRELIGQVERAGFRIDAAEQYNVVYWIWDAVQLKVPLLTQTVRAAERLERRIAKRWKSHSAHGFVVGRRVEG
jgi:SAM-dependent methyltransferase